MAKLNWKRKAIGAVCLSFVLAGGTCLALNDSHHTNYRYLIWKSGHAPQDYLHSIHLLLVDSDFWMSMRGKPLSQLRAWFPETAPAKPGSRDYEWLQGMDHGQGITFEVIVSSNVAIMLENGKLEHVIKMEG